MKVSDKSLYQLYLLKHAAKQNKGANDTPDSERLKTYKAEWRFQSNFGSGTEFESIAECQKFVNKVVASKTFIKMWADANSNNNIERLFMGNAVRVAAKQRNSGRGAAGTARPGEITLDTQVGMNQYTVIHELAHCVGHWHHGRSFRQTLVKLVSRFMGAATATFLKEEFKAGKLSYGNARSPISFENWVAARDRMAKMRSNKNPT